METLKLSKQDAIKFIESMKNPEKPNKALKDAKKTSRKLLKRRYD